jgi:hypothetical protein
MLEQGLTDYLNSGDQPDHNQMLAESEVQQAQVVLAAQDLVDKIQNMVEEVSEAQFKELPALVDSIKNNIGTDQSLQFNRDVTQALESLIANLQNTKQQLQTALNLVTGEVDTSNAMPMPGMDQTQMPPDMTAQEPSPDAEPPPTDLGTELQPLGGANLGRERR